MVYSFDIQVSKKDYFCPNEVVLHKDLYLQYVKMRAESTSDLSDDILDTWVRLENEAISSTNEICKDYIEPILLIPTGE